MASEFGSGVKQQLPRLVRLLVDVIVEPVATRDAPLNATEWAHLPQLAHRHGVSAVVPALLAGRGDVPSDVAETVVQLGRRRATAALRGAAELRQLGQTLKASGVRAVALKGPALSAWLYGDLAFRRFADLDLLVEPRQSTAALDALRAHGYALPEGMSRETAAAIFADLGAWPLSRAGSLPVDLHWRAAQRRFAAPVSTQEVIVERVPLDALGADVSIPSATHLAVLTLLHAAKHLWCTLEMLLAIATLMRRDDVEWGRAVGLLKKAHGWRGAAAGVALASDVFDVPLPRGIQPPDVSISDALLRTALDALQMAAGVFPDRWKERVAHREALDRRVDRMRYDAARLLAPTPLEWVWWPLPDSLSRLYPLIRMMRLGTVAAGTVLGHRPPATVTGTTAAPVPPGDGATPSIRAGRV